MHLHQREMDLTLVSQWLGNSQIETTLIYAHADTEHKRKAVNAAKGEELLAAQSLKRFKISYDEELKRLTGLS